jgi:hypothetical protein
MKTKMAFSIQRMSHNYVVIVDVILIIRFFDIFSESSVRGVVVSVCDTNGTVLATTLSDDKGNFTISLDSNGVPFKAETEFQLCINATQVKMNGLYY